MRYFKYDGLWSDIEALKRRYSDLSAQAQRQRRRLERLHKLGTAVFFLLFFVCFIGLVILIHWFWPEEETVFGEILAVLCKMFLGFVALIISAIVGAVAAAPLWGKHEKAEKIFMQQTLSRACSALREYYQFQEPFLVTKCYQSTDRQFNRHDVCIFIVDNELRITANLHYGFFHPEKDLGCYGLTRQEISLREAQYKDRAAVELQAGDMTFYLGCKARTFIEKNFLKSKGD